MNILLVDDEQFQLDTIKRGIRLHGHQVNLAKSGEEALAYLENNYRNTNLIITDYYMPGMNGISLIKYIRERYGEIPVILMTAYGDKTLVLEALRNRCDNYLDKPFRPKDLMTQIDEIQLQREKRKKRGQVRTSKPGKARGQIHRFVPLKRHEPSKQIEAGKDIASEPVQKEQKELVSPVEEPNLNATDLVEEVPFFLEEENPLERLGGGFNLAVPLVKVVFPIFIFLLMALTTFYLLVLPFFK